MTTQTKADLKVTIEEGQGVDEKRQAALALLEHPELTVHDIRFMMHFLPPSVRVKLIDTILSAFSRIAVDPDNLVAMAKRLTEMGLQTQASALWVKVLEHHNPTEQHLRTLMEYMPERAHGIKLRLIGYYLDKRELADLLNDGDGEVREKAWETFCQLNPTEGELRAVIHSYPCYRLQAAMRLLRFNGLGFQILMELMDDTEMAILRDTIAAKICAGGFAPTFNAAPVDLINFMRKYPQYSQSAGKTLFSLNLKDEHLIAVIDEVPSLRKQAAEMFVSRHPDIWKVLAVLNS